jgi:hypothetical protein
MRRSLLARWSTRLASFLRRVVSALDRVAGSEDSRMAALSARYPGAPEHWLRHIAKRAPQLAGHAPSPPREPEQAERRAEPPPPLHLVPRAQAPRRPVLALVGTRPAAPAATFLPRIARSARPSLRVLADEPRLRREVEFPERPPTAPHTFEPVSEAPRTNDAPPQRFPRLPETRRPLALPDIPDDAGRWPPLPDIDEAVLESLIEPPRLDELRREQEQGLWSA